MYNLDEIRDEIYKTINNMPEFRKEFTACPKDKLARYHHGLGTMIRNEYQLWYYDHEPIIVDGVDVSPHHPDAISQRIIEMVWEKFNNEENT